MAVYYATMRGSISSTTLEEIFVHTFAIQSTATVDAVANTFATLWQDCLNTGIGGYPLKKLFAPAVQYKEVTVANIINTEPPDPRLAAATHVQFTPIAGTGTGFMLPSQCTVAVSVKAGYRPNGVPQKGRMYLPTPTTSSVDTNSGLLIAGAATAIRDTMADWWAKMNVAGHKPSLWSRTYGTVTQWDNLRVGGTIDTQRRRRNELPEVYSQYVAVAP